MGSFVFEFFKTDLGFQLPDIIFSVMNGDRLVLGELLVDLMIMDLGKEDSGSLSEGSNSERLYFSFLFEFAKCIICFFFFFFAGPMLHHPPWKPIHLG